MAAGLSPSIRSVNAFYYTELSDMRISSFEFSRQGDREAVEGRVDVIQDAY